MFLIVISKVKAVTKAIVKACVNVLTKNSPISEILFTGRLLSTSLVTTPNSVILTGVLYPRARGISSHLIGVRGIKRRSAMLSTLTTNASANMHLVIGVTTVLLMFVTVITLTGCVLRNIVKHCAKLGS